jgi:hypothetical protein
MSADDYIVLGLASVSRPKKEPICHRRVSLLDEQKNSRGFDIISCEVYSDLQGGFTTKLTHGPLPRSTIAARRLVSQDERVQS